MLCVESNPKELIEVPTTKRPQTGAGPASLAVEPLLIKEEERGIRRSTCNVHKYKLVLTNEV